MNEDEDIGEGWTPAFNPVPAMIRFGLIVAVWVVVIYLLRGSQ